MKVIEPELYGHDTDKEMPDGGREGGQLVAALAAPPEDQRVDGELEEQAGEGGIEARSKESLLVNLPVHLMRDRSETHV